MKCLVIILLLFDALCSIHNVEGLKILGIFPFPAPSHYFLGSSLMKGLAEKGHDVTMISPFGEKEIPKGLKYRDIVTTGVVEELAKNNKRVNMFEIGQKNALASMMFMTFFLGKNAEETLNHTAVQKLIHSGETFDIVIIEQFVNDALKVLAHHFKAHLIVYSTVGASHWVNPLVGNPAPPSYVAELIHGYPARMTFTQRFWNTVARISGLVNDYFLLFPSQNKIAKKYLPDGPDLYDVLYNVSLILLNSHISTSDPVPTVPNMVEIGGHHVKPPKPLPKDLQEFLDEAKEGVVYFSLGSNLKSKDLPKEKRDALLKAFSKLKQKVLWKWEEDVLPGQPPNVKLGKWMPQQSILAHPNVKLFITHGGLLSTTETIYHGVPVLAIPVFGDQVANARKAETNGFGLMIQYHDLDEEKLSRGISELLSNPKYSENAKQRSRLFHDRPLKPMDVATYWVEYVARHNGATHFRSSALDLAWYQYFLLDVGLVIIGVVSLIVFLVYYIFKICCCRSKKSKEKSQ